jgi:hypothetical protein
VDVRVDDRTGRKRDCAPRERRLQLAGGETTTPRPRNAHAPTTQKERFGVAVERVNHRTRSWRPNDLTR